MFRALALCFVAVLIVVIATSVSATSPTNKQIQEAIAKNKFEGRHKILRQPIKFEQKENQHKLLNNLAAVDQAKRQIIMFSNWCNQRIYLAAEASVLFSGAWEQAPAEVIEPEASESFVAVADYGVPVHINGTVTYWGQPPAGSEVFPIFSMGFAVVKGEWVLDVSYPTASDTALIGAVETGKSAFYNILTGAEAGKKPVTCFKKK